MSLKKMSHEELVQPPLVWYRV